MLLLFLFLCSYPVAAVDITHTFADSFFVNVPVNASTLQSQLHPDLTVRQFQNTAWVSYIATQVTATKLGPVPVPAYTKGILVRTYVTDQNGKAGIFHFSCFFSNSAYMTLANRVYFKDRVSTFKPDPNMTLSKCTDSKIDFISPAFQMTAQYPCNSSASSPLPSGYDDFFVNSADIWYFQSSLSSKGTVYSSKAKTSIPKPARAASQSEVPKLSIIPRTRYPVTKDITPSICKNPGSCFFLPEFEVVLEPQTPDNN